MSLERWEFEKRSSSKSDKIKLNKNWLNQTGEEAWQIHTWSRARSDFRIHYFLCLVVNKFQFFQDPEVAQRRFSLNSRNNNCKKGTQRPWRNLGQLKREKNLDAFISTNTVAAIKAAAGAKDLRILFYAVAS